MENRMDREFLRVVGDKAFAEIIGDSCHITNIQRIPGMVYAEMQDTLYCLKLNSMCLMEKSQSTLLSNLDSRSTEDYLMLKIG